jgi:hypothetical protein
MPTAAELLFKIQATGQDELAKVAATVKTIGEGTRLTGEQLRTFDSTMRSLVGSGKGYRESLDEIARSNGVLSSSIRSAASEILLQQKAAEGDTEAIRKLSGAHQHLISDVQASGAAIRAFSGGSNVRAIEQFTSKVLGLGGAFQAIFPAIGAFAVGEALVRGVAEFVDKLQNALLASERLAGGFRNIAVESQSTNDALRVANDKLEDSIAKLERKPFNGIKLAIDEAVLSADKLGESLSRDQSKLFEFVKSSALTGIGGFIQRIATGEGSGKDVQEFLGGKTGFGGFQSTINDITDRGRKGILAAGGDQAATKAAQDKLNADLIAAYQKAIEKLDKDFGASVASDGSVRGELARGAKRDLQQRIDYIQLNGKNEGLEQQKARAEADKESAALAKQAAEKLREFNQELEKLGAVKQGPFAQLDRQFNDAAERLKQLNPNFKPGTQAYQEFQGDRLQALLSLGGDLSERNRKEAERKQLEQQELIERTQETAQRDAGKAFGQPALIADITKRNPLTPGPDSSQILRAINDQANQAIRTARVSGQRGDELEVAQKIAQIQLDAANKRKSFEDAIATTQKERDDAELEFQERLFDIRSQYEDALIAKQRKALEEAQSLAGKLFDAITNRQRGAGFELKQLFKSEATGQARQIFENLTSNTIKNVFGSIQSNVPNSLGPLLKGTLFDPAKGADPDQEAIKDNTKDAAGYLKGIYEKITGKSAVSSSDAASGGSASASSDSLVPGLIGVAASDIAKLGGGGAVSSAASAGGGILGSVLKLLGIGGGSGSGFQTGLSSVLSGGALSVLTGQSGSPLSEQIGAGVGLASAGIAGGVGIASGISQGGVRGDLSAAGSAAALTGTIVSNVSKLLGAASPILKDIPIVGQILGAALPLIGSFFGNGPAQRQKDLNNELAKAQYLAPTALNVTQGQNGTYEDFDARGQLRTSTLSAVPTVSEPYTTSRVINGQRIYYNAPGGVLAPYSGGATGTGSAPVAAQPIIVQAMDVKSFHDWVNQPTQQNAIGHAVDGHLSTEQGDRLANRIALRVSTT